MAHVPISLRVNDMEFEGVIDSSRSPRTAEAFLESLPIVAHPVSWGGEIYFGVGFHEDDEHATSAISIGDIAFWPPGDVVCIFFGPTPASTGAEPVPASPVNIIGVVNGAERIASAGSVGTITIEKR
jgi:hypothetical protein